MNKWTIETLLETLNATEIEPAALGQLLGRSQILVELQQAEAAIQKAHDRRASLIDQFEVDQGALVARRDVALADSDAEVAALAAARDELAERAKNALGG